MQIQVIKQPGGLLRPANQVDADLLSGLANGALLTGDFKQPRNPRFHRKFFAMLNFAYDYWQPQEQEYKGLKSEKSFKRFRNEVTVLAGWYIVTTDLRGNVKLEPKSISFADMDDTEFSEFYKAAFGVLWNFVLSQVQGMTPELAENTINQLVNFD